MNKKIFLYLQVKVKEVRDTVLFYKGDLFTGSELHVCGSFPKHSRKLTVSSCSSTDIKTLNTGCKRKMCVGWAFVFLVRSILFQTGTSVIRAIVYCNKPVPSRSEGLLNSN